MDDSERRRLRAKYKQLCEAAGYPEGVAPSPWNVPSKPPPVEEDVDTLLERNETLPTEGGFFSTTKEAK